jgi:hypothetical protein
MSWDNLITGASSAGATGLAIWAAIATRKNSKEATAAAEVERLDNREDAYTRELKADHDRLKEDFQVEKLDRRRTEQSLWLALNAYRVRDAAWWELYHVMSKRIIELGGAPIPLPAALVSWPEMPPAPMPPGSPGWHEG